jgi:hypothetical protein
MCSVGSPDPTNVIQSGRGEERLVQCRYNLGEDVEAGDVFEPFIGQRDCPSQLTVYAVPITGLERNGVDSQ